MFESDSSKANDKDYFTEIYRELDDLKVMRAAFDFFSAYDVSEFNYRGAYRSLSTKVH